MSKTYFLTFNADGFLTFTNYKINCLYVFFRKNSIMRAIYILVSRDLTKKQYL